jgi:hypothetical protein
MNAVGYSYKRQHECLHMKGCNMMSYIITTFHLGGNYAGNVILFIHPIIHAPHN